MNEKLEVLVLVILYGSILIAVVKLLIFMFKKK